MVLSINYALVSVLKGRDYSPYEAGEALGMQKAAMQGREADEPPAAGEQCYSQPPPPGCQRAHGKLTVSKHGHATFELSRH